MRTSVSLSARSGRSPRTGLVPRRELQAEHAPGPPVGQRQVEHAFAHRQVAVQIVGSDRTLPAGRQTSA